MFTVARRPRPPASPVPRRSRRCCARCWPRCTARSTGRRRCARARPWVQAVRDKPAPFWAMESLLREYPISSAEGLALMRLAEALLRVPDAETAIALTADQLGKADFDADARRPAQAAGQPVGQRHRAVEALPARGRRASAACCKRLGAQTVVAATVRAIQLLGRQFVLGRTSARRWARPRPARKASTALRFSYDMLGEGARTEADAQRYLASYRERDRTRSPAAQHGARPGSGRRHLDQAAAPCSRATRTRSASACSPSCCRACGSWSSRPRAPTST